MGQLKKRMPSTYDPAVIEEVFNDLYNSGAETFVPIVQEIPKENEGKNGSLRIDNNNSVLYIKINGKWKTFNPA